MRMLRYGGGIVGISVMGVLLHQVGWTSIRESLGMLGWGYLIVVAYPLTWMLLNTQGWKMALHRSAAKGLSFFDLVQVRTAGESFNVLLPSGYVGGEPLKAQLLSQWVSLAEATSSVLIAKAAQSVALVAFVGLGMTLCGKPGEDSPITHPPEAIALGLLTLGIVLFVILLSKGSFAVLGRRLHRLTNRSWFHRAEPHLKAIDSSIGAFYREGKGRFLSSIGWHLGGWVAGAMEVAIIFALIGHPVTWREAWFVGAVSQLAAVIGLFAPAGVGLYEGGHYLAAAALGMPPSLGVSVALIRRLRELFWNATGLWIFWRMSKPPLKCQTHARNLEKSQAPFRTR